MAPLLPAGPATRLVTVLLVGACCAARALAGEVAGESGQVLWAIGEVDNSPAEFALAGGGYRQFFANFGSPDMVYHVGLSDPKKDWPCVLPGPVDDWAGGGRRAAAGEWDMLHTLPIGFVIERPPTEGTCALVLHVCDAHPLRPPHLRATINGAIFEHQLTAGGGGSASLMTGDLQKAKPQTIRITFPATLLRAGYNEIALRSTDGSWLLFDAVELETPAGAKLAAVTKTVIEAVTTAPYAVSADPKMPATVRVAVFRAGAQGKVAVQIGDAAAMERPVEPGRQVLEFAAAASAAGKPTRVVVRGEDGRVIEETRLSLPAARAATPSDYVDVFKGTAHSRWMIAPGPWMPFGMVKLAPDNEPQRWACGYDYGREHIDCFSHIHEWTMGGLGMMPIVGAVRTQPGLDAAGYSSRFDKATERGGIGFYEVVLKDSGIKAELTATTRAGMQRYTFPASEAAHVVFDFLIPNEYPIQVLAATVRRSGPAEIEGAVKTRVTTANFNQDYELHFVAQFNRGFDRMGAWQAKERRPEVTEAQLAGDCGAWVDFKTKAGEQVVVRTGISLVSVANARLNLERELAGPLGWDFAAVVQNQRRVWDELFARVEIETPDAREKTRFYTNFYRAMSGRNTWSDVNGEWIDPEERKQRLTDPRAVMLGGDAFWNTFWNLNQLMNLAAPEWSARWTNSLLAMYDTSGWLSKGPAGLEYIPIMVAEHEIPLLVAAHQHGIKGIDAAKILAAAVKMQTTPPQPEPGGNWVGNEHLVNYLKNGFVAVDGPAPSEPPKWRRPISSNTLEYAYDDWCVAELARALGRTDVATTFAKRAQSWRNMFDAELGYTRPRKSNGEWVSPFDPYAAAGFTEGNAWQYTWFVPHDVPGLIAAMGRDRFIRRLNEGFERSAPARFTAPSAQHNFTAINHGNQPSMQVAWLFNWADQPWLTQKWTRAILETYYGHHPSDAYLGDEDQGQMSGWFVMAALGFFQTDGGCRVHPVYELAAPLYAKVTIHLSAEHYGGKTFVIEARGASATNKYIQSTKLNGAPLNRWWLRQHEVMAGGKLEFELGAAPNEAWARGCGAPGDE